MNEYTLSVESGNYFCAACGQPVEHAHHDPAHPKMQPTILITPRCACSGCAGTTLDIRDCKVEHMEMIR